MKLPWLWILIDCNFSQPFRVHSMSVDVRAWAGKEGRQNFQVKDLTDHLFQSACYCVEESDAKQSLVTQTTFITNLGLEFRLLDPSSALLLPVYYFPHDKDSFLCLACALSWSSLIPSLIYILYKPMCLHMAHVYRPDLFRSNVTILSKLRKYF